MSYMGIPRGRNKAAPTVRVVIINANPTNNASLYLNSATPTTVTFASSSWLELINSTPQVINFIELFDSTGNTARFGIGSGGAEADLFLDLPGGNGHIPVQIAAGSRLSLRPLVAPSVGAEISINFWD
jgi:hypothetical protein